MMCAFGLGSCTPQQVLQGCMLFTGVYECQVYTYEREPTYKHDTHVMMCIITEAHVSAPCKRSFPLTNARCQHAVARDSCIGERLPPGKGLRMPAIYLQRVRRPPLVEAVRRWRGGRGRRRRRGVQSGEEGVHLRLLTGGEVDGRFV